MELSRPAGVRELRARLCLAQRELAEALGVDLSALQRWEQGDRRVSGPVARLLLVLDRDPDALTALRAAAVVLAPSQS